jgi:nucleotide-binding universal stress UspA family protein
VAAQADAVTPTFETSVAGIVIALVFGAALSTVMLWMFRVPRAVSADVAKARRSLDRARLILVPTTGSSYSQRGVELACRLAQEQGASILLVYVIEVPRTLPLSAPLARAEEEASSALDTATEVVALHSLPVRSVIHRARTAGDGIIAAATDHRADLIVTGIAAQREHGHSGWGRTADTLLHRAPCEVIFDRIPE